MTPVKARYGMVAAGHEETARASMRVLEAGGNAFDAAIAGFLAACVAEPVLASLGGGGFLVAHSADGEIDVFDFFTDTPIVRPDPDTVNFEKITADFGVAQQDFHIGLGSVATPGAVAGIYEVHNTLGKAPMTEIVAPAVELSRNGVVMSEFQAYILSVVGPIYNHTDEGRKHFCVNGDATDLLAQGARYHPEDFADFLSAMVQEGPRFFYEGEIASRIASLDGCTIGRADLAEYSVQRRVPVESRISGHDVFMNPPPAIGGALISLALELLDGAAMSGVSHGSAQHAGVLANVSRQCNNLRKESLIDIDPSKGARRLKELTGHPPSYRGTTHISVADSDGNMAALTVSNGEGCGYLIPNTGIMLNNMLGEEDLNQQGFFAWDEGVRMSSMMTPGMMRSPDGTWTAFGSGGSNRIRSAITQVLINLACFGMNEKEAVDAPRLHLESGKLSVEPGFDQDAFEGVKDMVDDLHLWPEKNMFFGGTHIVSRKADGLMTGAGDKRRDGVCLAG